MFGRAGILGCFGFVAVLGLAGAARGEEALDPSRVDPTLKGLRFGMTRDQVVEFLKNRIAARYDQEWQGTREVREQDRISREKREAHGHGRHGLRHVRRAPSAWDASVIQDEFAHGTGDEMMHEREGEVHLYLFFSKGALYKLVRTTGVKKATDLLSDLKRVYGAPAATETEPPAGKGALKAASWTGGLLSVRLEDRERAFGCSIIRWALTEADRAVHAEWDRVRKHGVDDMSPLIKQSQQTAGDDVDPVDAMIGAQPKKDLATPAKKPRKAPKK